MGQPVEEPELTAVKVAYSLTLSNGNYGSERVEATYWANVRPGQDPEELECDLAGRARDFVEGRLKASRFEAVRQALETPEERRARLDAEERAWREEREARQRLRANGGPTGETEPEEEPF